MIWNQPVVSAVTKVVVVAPSAVSHFSSRFNIQPKSLFMYYTNYPGSGQTMSALESPPSLAAAWSSEPWSMSAAAAAGVIDPHDFYKVTFSASSSSPPMMGIAAAVASSGHNTSGSTHGGSSGGGHNDSGSGSTTGSRKRVVNFKLDIKPDPEDACVPQMQKVPSISDLSDPDSSLDIPTQVGLKIQQGYCCCCCCCRDSMV